LLDRCTDEVGGLTRIRLREEARVVEAKNELTNRYAHGSAGCVEVFGWHATWSFRSLGAKLAGALTNWAELSDPRLMLSHPGDLGVADLLEPSLVSVNRAQGRNRLCEPEFQIRMVSGELVQMLRCETTNLARDELRSRDRVRGSLGFHLHASHGPHNVPPLSSGRISKR
jgi:hypothetical protein